MCHYLRIPRGLVVASIITRGRSSAELLRATVAGSDEDLEEQTWPGPDTMPRNSCRRPPRRMPGGLGGRGLVCTLFGTALTFALQGKLSALHANCSARSVATTPHPTRTPDGNLATRWALNGRLALDRRCPLSGVHWLLPAATLRMHNATRRAE